MPNTSLGNEIYLGRPKIITISGTVKSGTGTGLSRRVIVYRNGAETTVSASTTSSGVDGTYAISVNGGPNERFRVIAIGAEGSLENSKVLDFIKGT